MTRTRVAVTVTVMASVLSLWSSNVDVDNKGGAMKSRMYKKRRWLNKVRVSVSQQTPNKAT
jgi:hypothetical protein